MRRNLTKQDCLTTSHSPGEQRTSGEGETAVGLLVSRLCPSWPGGVGLCGRGKGPGVEED